MRKTDKKNIEVTKEKTPDGRTTYWVKTLQK